MFTSGASGLPSGEYRVKGAGVIMARISDSSLLVPLSDQLWPFAEGALDRLAYLYPKCEFRLEKGGIRVLRAGKDDDIQRDIAYVVYRSKIAAEGADLRRLLFQAILAK